MRNGIGSATRRRKLSEFFGLVGILIGASAVIAASGPDEKRIPVTFIGGYETDSRDNGRPVALIASALGVPEKVFREAFTHVTPATAGNRPEPGQVRQNKEVLLRALGSYGVTNNVLDRVSDYYRYRPGGRELWRHVPATAYAIVTDGVVTGFKITNAGSGYTSPPVVSVPGLDGVKAKVTLSFGRRFDSNGSIRSIAVSQP